MDGSRESVALGGGQESREGDAHGCRETVLGNVSCAPGCDDGGEASGFFLSFGDEGCRRRVLPLELLPFSNFEAEDCRGTVAPLGLDAWSTFEAEGCRGILAPLGLDALTTFEAEG